MERYEIKYKKELPPMQVFDAIKKISGTKIYHHNVSNGIIGTEISDISKLNGLAGILTFTKD